MAAWGPLQRQLVSYLARHPQIQRAVRNASQRVAAHPSFQNAKASVRAAIAKAGARAAEAGGESAQKQSHSGVRESTAQGWWRRARNAWQKHKGRVMSFVVANFMAILLFVQFSPVLWHWLKSGVRYLTDAPTQTESDRKERRKRRKAETAEEQHDFKVAAPDDSMRDAILSSVPPPHGVSDKHAAPSSAMAQPSWQASSSLFDDTSGATHQSKDVQQSFNEMHKDVFRGPDGGVPIDFNTSFLVKMGDETTFTSSLEREALTGNSSARM